MFYFGKETFRYYAFTSCIRIEDYIWFTTIHVNALFKLNIKTKKTEIATWLPGESESWLCYGLGGLYKNRKLVLFPHNSKEICIYDIDTGELEVKSYIDENETDRADYNIFSSCIICDDSAFLFPGRYPGVIKYDLETKTLVKYNLLQKVPKITYEDRIYIWGSVKNEDGFLLSCAQSNNVVNIKNDGTIDIKQIDSVDSEGFSDILMLDDKLYLSHKTRNIITVCENEKILDINFDDEINSIVSGIKYMFSYKECIYIVPMLGESIIEYNPKDGSKKKLYTLNLIKTESYEKFQADFANNILCCEKISNDELLLFSLYDMRIMILNLDTQEIDSFEAKFDDEIVEEINNKSKKEYISFEYGEDALHCWLKGLA